MNDDIMLAIEVYYDLADKSSDDDARLELRAAAAVMAMMGGAVLTQQMNDDLTDWLGHVYENRSGLPLAPLH